MRLALLAIVLLGGCSQPLTELVVVVDTDHPVPGELDTVVLSVDGPDMPEEPVRVSLTSIALPVTLGLVHRGGALGPVTVTASGELGGTERVRRTARTSFVSGESRVLRIDLVRACDGAACTGETTCEVGACIGIDVDPATLPLYDGTIGRSDVGPPQDVPGLDAPELPDVPVDACMVTGAEACNGRDEDCDGTVDEGVCTCDPPCMLDHAVARCVAGSRCEISSCETGFANCDDMQETGCERSTRTLTDCNACNTPCAFPSGLPGTALGTPTCADGTCRVATCSSASFGDCNGLISDGCETNLTNSAMHCGRCDNPCTGGMMRCMASVCR
jgi:hypothetical protein